MDNKEIVRAWEQRVSPETAHIDAKAFLKLPALFGMFDFALRSCDLEGKKILDFGCGGGFLGKWLFDQSVEIGKYIGLDIAERSLSAARARLQSFVDNKKAMLIKITPWGIDDLNVLNIDVLVSFNTIQHFPTKEYLDYFLDTVNQSGAKKLVLQYRVDKETRFQENPYKTTHEINLACWTNADYIKEKLTMYQFKKLKKSKKSNFETSYFEIIES